MHRPFTICIAIQINIIADIIQPHGEYPSQTQKSKLIPPSHPLRPHFLYEAACAAESTDFAWTMSLTIFADDGMVRRSAEKLHDYGYDDPLFAYNKKRGPHGGHCFGRRLCENAGLVCLRAEEAARIYSILLFLHELKERQEERVPPLCLRTAEDKLYGSY